MRKLALLVLVALPLYAQEVHKASDPDAFLTRVRAGIIHDAISPVIVDAVTPLAAKTFNITAKTFEFDITPTPFVVTVGDSITLNISVPSNDSSGKNGHGFFLENYFEQTNFFIQAG